MPKNSMGPTNNNNNNNNNTMSTKPILSELKFFVNGVSNIYRGLPPDISEQLVKCSLNLLEDLPASREAVLEYFSMVFDTSVGTYINFIDKEPNGTPPEDETIGDIQDALENLVTKGPPAWAPLISSWSLRILGTLSNKYSGGRGMDIGSSCTRWLGSTAMRCLLGLAASCFGKLNSIETEECISILLSTFVQNSPHFDWVVARLGGYFPLKVISKILQCGLKGFVGNFNSTLDSEVGILGYLSFAHESDLKFALKEMMQAVMYSNAIITQPQVNTLPYLMHLSSMSEILLQPIVNVFLELFNESLIPTLIIQSKQWPPNFNVRDIVPTLSNLALKLKINATKTILTLARIAMNYNWCKDFLENIMQELETVMWDDQMCPLLNDTIKDESINLLWSACTSICSIEQQTAVRMILIVSTQSPFIYHQTIAKLLSNSYNEQTPTGLSALVRILSPSLGSREFLQIKSGIELALEEIMLNSDRKFLDELQIDLNILKNLVTLVRLEKEMSLPNLRQSLVSKTLNDECIPKLLDIFGGFLKKEMKYVENSVISSSTTGNDNDDDDDDLIVKRIKLAPINQLMVTSGSCGGVEQSLDTDEIDCKRIRCEQIHILANLINMLEVGGLESLIGMTEVIKLAQFTVKYFFWSLIEKTHHIRIIAVHRAFSILNRQCTVRKASRTIALRELIEGALFYYGNLFGAHNEITISNHNNNASRFIDDNQPYHYYSEQSHQHKDEDLLIKLNQKQGAGGATNAVRSILHAGIIGHGLKKPTKESVPPDAEMKNLFLSAIAACCKSDDWPTTIDGFSTVSLLLVEMVSTDVMYNGLPWPDEEMFTKVTIERDLQIRRTFRNAPILWSLLGLVSSYRPALCFTSVLLRALCASVLHQWRAKTVDIKSQAQNIELYDVTKKLLEILALGQLIPPPLNYLHMVIEHLDPPELAVVLKECIWNYMKENVPSPVLFTVDPSGLHWRDFTGTRPPAQFIDPLRNIMQRKLPILGSFYHLMFVMPELSENVQQLTTCNVSSPSNTNPIPINPGAVLINTNPQQSTLAAPTAAAAAAAAASTAPTTTNS